MLVTLIPFRAVLLRSLLQTVLAYAHCLLLQRMSPHLTSSELHQVLEWKSEQDRKDIHNMFNMLAEQRTRELVAAYLSFRN